MNPTSNSDQIVVIGSSNVDMVVKTDRHPLPGETRLGGVFFMNAGGKGANQAVAAARLGGSVTFVTKVGNDIFGKQTIDGLKEEDRKSTRLNSSHSQISYAVFCLKKKNN